MANGCGSCDYYWKEPHREESDYGLCHRYPPKPVGEAPDHHLGTQMDDKVIRARGFDEKWGDVNDKHRNFLWDGTRYPIVWFAEGCGEFTERREREV
ncbi:MAG TPA: hypothetical protein EYO02_00140 [Rhodospirillales bacterium]|nr:hypothetical protein [Rhodospirillales bacterium]